MNQKKNSSVLKKVFALLAVCVLLVSAIAVPASATESGTDAADVAKGVFMVMFCEPNPDDKHEALTWSMGSGFLINENTVVTSYHVIHPGVTDDGADYVQYLKTKYGNNWENKMEIRVYYQASNYVTATEIKTVANSTADYTALKLANSINGSYSLKVKGNVAETVQPGDVVRALGYPYELSIFEDQNTSSFSPRDVDTRTGNINKPASLNGVAVLNHSATLFNGMSGGPLVDANGAVVGINALAPDATYNYSISVDLLVTSLDAMGIEYEKVGPEGPSTEGGTTAPTEVGTTAPTEGGTTEPPVVEADKSALNAALLSANSKTEADYTPESFAGLKTAITEAEAVKANAEATQEEIDAAADKVNAAISALAEKEAAPTGLIIGIAAAVIVIILIVVIIIAVSKKNKAKEDVYAVPAPADIPFTGVQNGGFNSAPAAPAVDFRPGAATSVGAAETGVLSSASETTVLSAGSNETTVLSSKPYATLTRKSNNETVKVASEKFVIGKERSKVSYCIDGNGAISRSHAQIVKSGNSVKVIDLGSKNGTFVNGVRCDANVPVVVKSGDKIVLADEEFSIALL